MRKIFDIINRIKELESKEDNIFKAWESAQLGEIRTHSDGKKYRKVSQTGDPRKDWQLVTQDKGGKGKDQSVSKQGGNEQSKEKQLTTKQLAEHAKNSSENSLQNVIKQSDDPRLRETAHKELDRREKEEKPQEDEKDSSNVKKESKKDKIPEQEEMERKENFVLDLAELIGANEDFDIDKYKDLLEPYISKQKVYRYWSDPNMREKKLYSTSKSIDAIKQMVEENELDDGVITEHEVDGFDPYQVLKDFKKYAPESEHRFIDDTIRSNSYQKEILAVGKLKVNDENTVGKVQDQEVTLTPKKDKKKETEKKVEKSEEDSLIKKDFEKWL